MPDESKKAETGRESTPAVSAIDWAVDQREALEVELREAGARQMLQTTEPDLDLLMRRARREVGLRDVVGFGFARLLGTMLSLLATVVGRSQERAAAPQEPRRRESWTVQDPTRSTHPDKQGD